MWPKKIFNFLFFGEFFQKKKKKNETLSIYKFFEHLLKYFWTLIKVEPNDKLN